MLRALHTAALGMSAQQNNVDNTANNLANTNTTGFKRSSIVFQDLLYQTVQVAGAAEGHVRFKLAEALLRLPAAQAGTN